MKPRSAGHFPVRPRMQNIDIFIRQVQSRSQEHQKAMRLLAQAKLSGQMISVLRQELDSMVRVMYLLTQSLEHRATLIDASVSGGKWSRENSRASVTDKEMVDAAQKLHGWSLSVYKFGCAFIHLSGLHDYNDRDPLAQLPVQERTDILEHCRHYHGGPATNNAEFSELIPFLPRVLERISANLGGYLGALHRGELLDGPEV